MECAKIHIKVWLKVCVVSIYKLRINRYIHFEKKYGVSCVAVNCSNSRKNSPELTFHRLPMLNDDNREIREWRLANVKRHGHYRKKIISFYVLTILKSLASNPCSSEGI